MSHSAEVDDEWLPSLTTEPPTPPAKAPTRPRRGDPMRWIAAAAVLIAAVALGFSIWALARSDSPPAPSAQQVADAKTRACAAYDVVRKAVAVQTQSAMGDDPAANQSAASNARLAMAVGSQHIIDSLDPAVPPELSGLLRSVAGDLQSLTVNALAGTADTDTDQIARLKGLEQNSAKIVELCR